MKTRTICLSMLFSLLLISGSALGAGRLPEEEIVEHNIPSHPLNLNFESRDWSVPSAQQYRHILNNGLRSYIAVDSTLPIVEITAYINYSSLNDPEGKEGLGTLMSRLLRLGGTEEISADSLNEFLDLMAINFSFSQSESHITFKGTFLSEYQDTALSIMEQMFFHPAFEEERVEREKRLIRESLRHRFVNPAPALNAAFQKQQYTGSNASRMTTASSIENISREDLKSLHDKVFKTDNIVLSVAGKIDKGKTIAKLESIFPQAEQTTSLTPFDNIEIRPETKALIVHRPINQAYVRMALPLFKRPHPDYYSVSLLNMILGGGGFTSRLGTKIRSDAGLTYSIHSRAESNYLYPGTLFIEFNTRKETLPLAIDLIYEEIERIIMEGVTEEELQSAKTALLAQLPSMFRSAGDITSTYAWNEMYSRSQDHFVLYPEEINKLTVEDINNVARKYLNPDNFTYTIIADSTILNRLPESKRFDLSGIENKKFISINEIETLP
ncbi:peptidase M16 domain protein [Chitinispirillum alkaliphilum]|nr:peptidase M16 domain protein [Chitinispirillum alkaliphilum]